jgi:hypothetical protein
MGSQQLERSRTGERLEVENAPPEPFTPGDRVIGTILGGLLAALAMFLTLAGFALSQGRGFTYPLHAVQGLMSGRRVIPDHPNPMLKGERLVDGIFGPLWFSIPALVVAGLVAWWVTRAGRRRGEAYRPLHVVLPAVVIVTAAFFLFVVALGYQQVDLHSQRFSSGWGVRALGMPAWITAHAVYAAALTLLLGPAVRFAAHLRENRATVTTSSELHPASSP